VINQQASMLSSLRLLSCEMAFWNVMMVLVRGYFRMNLPESDFVTSFGECAR
jgi:hypothetical protein